MFTNMSSKIMFVGILMLIFAFTVSAQSDVTMELLKHIDRLDMKLAAMEHKHETEIEALKQDNAQRESRLMRKIDELTGRVASLEKKNEDLKHVNKVDDSAKEGEDLNDIRDSTKNKVSQIRPRPIVLTNGNGNNPRRALSTDLNIAFSAYMDHDADNLGVGQTVHFNKILLNDGNGYNMTSGVFTAPVAGVYSFIFFIGQRDSHESVVSLFVNDVKIVDARAETHGLQQDVQGGNSATLKVAANDVVFVKIGFGAHLEGSAYWRHTTFSGFLLYPVEDGSVTVGK